MSAGTLFMARSFRIPEGAIKIPIPDAPQETDYTCGAAALHAICHYYGVGPGDEHIIAKDMAIDPRVGANPDQVIKAVRKYGLDHEVGQPMLIKELIRRIDQHRPTMCMLQAYGGRLNYEDDWKDGHWVVAIGYDERGIYFEDPSQTLPRGYLTYPELQARWHDTGRRGRRIVYYGVSIWKKTKHVYPEYLQFATHMP
jgi:predicted double-glycine peptidase